MRRQIFILFLAFSLLLSACGSEGGAASSSSASSPPAEDHSVGGSPAPEEFAAPLTLAAYPTASFHPVLSGNKANLTLAPLLYEGLFAVDSQFQAVPLLCEGYLSVEHLLQIADGCEGFCTACFGGAYPTAIPRRGDKDRFERKIRQRIQAKEGNL